MNSKKEVFSQDLNLKNQRVFINLDSKALGDNIAWLPYVESFRQRWGCKVIVTTFWNNLFAKAYPELEFMPPGSVAHNLYAQYKIGCFDNDSTRNRNNWREIPMQKVAADILGLPFVEIRTKVNVNNVPLMGRRFVCISDHSTMQAKYWNYPGGWQQIIDYLHDLAYDVIAISKDPTGLTKLVPVNNKPIEETASLINNCAFFIGVGSGLSWLAWALNKKVIMISGFSDPFTEFISDNYRLSPPQGVCHGCFNDKSLVFDRSWNWCPRNKNYECSIKITPEMVKEKIDLLISHLNE
jgi:autotransporter strand-loop-strand O-heptosyltransferase